MSGCFMRISTCSLLPWITCRIFGGAPASTKSSASLFESFYLFLPESIVISLISPSVFNLLHKIWFRSGHEMEGAES